MLGKEDCEIVERGESKKVKTRCQLGPRGTQERVKGSRSK